LKPVLKTKYKQPLPETRPTRWRTPDVLFEKVPDNVREMLLPLVGDFYKVSPSKSSVWKSINLMDQDPCYDFRKHHYWSATRALVEDMLDPVWSRTGPSSLDTVLVDMVIDTASGFPFRVLGFKKKKDVLANNDLMTYCLYINFDDPDPIWSVSGKVEWYPSKKIDDDKIRTFIIPPFHLLLWQLLLYKEQNEAMKGKWWSAYGFNPYRGGVDRMARRLAKCKRTVTLDVVKWDRKLPVMDEVYEIRNMYVPPSHVLMAQWTTRNTIRSYLLLPDGTVVKKKCGNNSGSGDTTVDNIVAHEHVSGLNLMTLYEGNSAYVAEVPLYLFGDDSIGGLPDVPQDMTDVEIEESYRATYRLFGFELDPFKISDSPVGHEFLGFTIVEWQGYYIPRYPVGRIAASFCYCIENLKMPALVSKAWTLTVMSAGSGPETYSLFADALYWMLDSQFDNRDPVVASYVEIGVPSYEACMSFYTGLESSYSFDLFDYSVLEDGGIKLV